MMRNHFKTQALAAVFLTLAMASAEEEKPTGGPSEGIKVHGHWTIDVLNPDGSVASHQEFANSLLNGGRSFLAQLLGRSTTVPYWIIDSGLTCAIPTQPQLGGPCYIVEPGQPSNFVRTFRNLTLTVTGDTLELAGSLTAENSGVISNVSVLIGEVFSPTPFSGKDLSPNVVSVAAGQIVQIKVVYSFS
jgi:hypothetical protein